MRRRPPPFALVLVAIAAALAAALALTSTGRSPAPSTQPPVVGGTSPGTDCVDAQASAESTMRTTVVGVATVRLPVTVTAQAASRGSVVSATRMGTIVQRASVSRPVAVRDRAVQVRRACARGASPRAATGVARQQAYDAALKAAQLQATGVARQHLAALAVQLKPGTFALAHSLASERAGAAAGAERQKLAAEAAQEATQAAAARG